MAERADKAHQTQNHCVSGQNFGTEAYFKGFQGYSAARSVYRKRRHSFYGNVPPCRTSSQPQPEARCSGRFPRTSKKNKGNLRPYILIMSKSGLQRNYKPLQTAFLIIKGQRRTCAASGIVGERENRNEKRSCQCRKTDTSVSTCMILQQCFVFVVKM